MHLRAIACCDIATYSPGMWAWIQVILIVHSTERLDNKKIT